MKKFFSLLITVMAVLCFTVSCSNSKNELTGLQNSKETKEIIVNCGDTVSLTIEDYNEYEDFIYKNKLPENYSFYDETYKKTCAENKGLPENFITYDKISHMGEFESFIYLSNVISGDNSTYMYSLMDENGYNVNIRFKLNEEGFSEAENILITENIDDFRMVTSEIACCTFVDNVKYTYASGKLLSIKMVYENVTITITGNSVLSDYPVDGTDTFISRLLSPNTASEALAQFEAALETVTE